VTVAWVRFTTLFAGVVFILAAYGLTGSLLSLALADRGLGAWVGPMGAAYFVGLGLGSLRAEGVIAAVGYLRAYGMLTAIATLGMLAVALFEEPGAWVAARLLQGLALGGLYVCIESWLGSAAEPAQRGRILALYQVIVYLGLIGGQGLMGWLADDVVKAMVVAAMLLCVAALPVGATRQEPPSIVVMPRFRFAQLWQVASVGMVGAAVAGIVTGAVYTVAPAAGLTAGLNDGQVAWMMAAFIGGGLLLQLPLGRASDTLDRRVVLAAVGALAAAGGLVSMAAVAKPELLVVVSAFEGGWVFAIYTIAMAYTYDRVEPDRLVSANAAMLAVFCAGSMLGAIGSSAALAAVGPVGFFAVLAAPTAVLAIVAGRAASIWDALPDEAQGDVVLVPRTSPVLAELDPRIDWVEGEVVACGSDEPEEE